MAVLRDTDPAWLKLHSHSGDGSFSLSSSKISDVLGVGFMTAKALYEIMTGVKREKDVCNEATEWGKTHEDVAADYFMQKCTTLDQYYPMKGFMVQHGKIPYLFCTPDRILVPKSLADPFINLEIKCPYYMDIPRSVDKIPRRTVCQVLFQLMVLDLPTGILLFWSPDSYAAYRIDRNLDFELYMLEKIEAFRDCVRSRTPPPRGGWKQETHNILNKVYETITPFE